MWIDHVHPVYGISIEKTRNLAIHVLVAERIANHGKNPCLPQRILKMTKKGKVRSFGRKLFTADENRRPCVRDAAAKRFRVRQDETMWNRSVISMTSGGVVQDPV